MTTPIDGRVRAQLADGMVVGQREIGRQEVAGPIDHWCPTGVPGYMQTEAYAQAVIKASGAYTDSEVERVVADRMARCARTTTITYQRRIVLTPAGVNRPIASNVEMSRQWAKIMDLALLDHMFVRVLPEESPLNSLPPFQILHGAGIENRVQVEGLLGCYTPPGAPDLVTSVHRGRFARLWEASQPYPG